MARKRASMREGPLAELFRATEAAQQQQGKPEPEPEPEPQPEVKAPPVEPLEETVEHAPPFEPVVEPPVRVSGPGEGVSGEPGGTQGLTDDFREP